MMELTGIGLYTLAEAERLTGAARREIHRWLFGYRYRDRFSPPLWQTELSSHQEIGRYLSFRDLLELRIVKAFVQYKVPLTVIRSAIRNAEQIFSTRYPFTTHRFLTDGRSVFYEALHEHGDVELTDLVRRQIVFEHIIRPELYAGIEFSKSGEATKWFPVKQSKRIVLDPNVSFGKPVIAKAGIKTEVLAASYAAEKNKKVVAALYGVSVPDVEAALRYERMSA